MEFAAGQLWSLMGAFALLQTFIPPQLRRFVDSQLESLWDKLGRAFNRHTFMEVHEHVQGNFKGNLLYRDVELYLSSLDRMHETDYLRVHRSADNSGLTFTLPPGETIEDSFMGAQLWWTHICTQKEDSQQHQMFWDYRGRRDSNKENRSFSLKMLRADKSRILPAYFDHISKIAKDIERRNTQRKLYSNADGGDWEEVDFKHPSSFDTLALLPELKDHIKADLKAFADGEGFYHSVGKAWKRGYLLYGPPGTGKSSMIAAMANFLNYDIYDLELTGVHDNSQLKSLLITTTRKSIIVIEDIDCSLDLTDRSAKGADPINNASSRQPNKESTAVEEKQSKVTLSGLLNFTDGLWSCCGEERIFVFTTNHKERLDPALLRSGRMDFHILLSYCTFPAFKLLAANYLGVREHELYPNVERAMEDSKVTPAEVVELLLSNKGSAEVALERVMAALHEASTTRKDRLKVASSQQQEEGMGSNGDLNKPAKSKRFRKLKLQFVRLLSNERLACVT